MSVYYFQGSTLNEQGDLIFAKILNPLWGKRYATNTESKTGRPEANDMAGADIPVEYREGHVDHVAAFL